MRFHTTLAHGQKRTDWEEAYATQDAFADRGDDGTKMGGSAEADAAYADETAKLHAYLSDPVTTPIELQTKIANMRSRGPFAPDNMCWNDADMQTYLDRMERDLARMQGWPCSDAMLDAWAQWRDHDDRYRLAATDKENDALLPERDRIYRGVQECPCTTPGDFIVKQYLRLVSMIGSTLYGEAKKNMTGNLYDIDIDNPEGFGGTFEDIEHPACYGDIDATDIGANLLAYGLPYFSPEAWMKRADAIGLRVDLTQQQDGRWMFGQHMDLEGDENRGNNTRLRREQDRLCRIIANDFGGESRIRLLADEIRREWPHLVRPFPVKEVV